MIRRRRLVSVVLLLLLLASYGAYNEYRRNAELADVPGHVTSENIERSAHVALGELEVKPRASKTNYSREKFGGDWAEIKGCDLRNLILQRDLKEVTINEEDGCRVMSGMLKGPYTGEEIDFAYGVGSSNEVHIDHVVALSDAWQKGAQQLSGLERDRFANDALNLLAVDGEANMDKSDSDASSWLPPDKDYRCRYVARQIAVKIEYSLWVSEHEEEAMRRVLNKCPTQQLPKVER